MVTRLQQHSNAYFPMPSELTPDELLDLEVAHRLLAGETSPER